MKKPPISGTTAPPRGGAAALSARYPVWFCDIWGVAHNGVRPHKAACEALIRHRERGGTVVFITNSPRPRAEVVRQLASIGVPRGAWDAIVTSGDVTRALVSARRGEKVFHLGPERDAPLRRGLPVVFTGPEEAQAVLCSGLRDDRTERPEDYASLLAELAGRGLPMICANPDTVVQVGEALVPCAGALAAIYERLGGRVLMAGKPFAPIYDECLKKAQEAAGRPVGKEEILAIGDGLATDILGARDFGVTALCIAAGIHREELKAAAPADIAERIGQAAPGVRLAGVMTALTWEGETP